MVKNSYYPIEDCLKICLKYGQTEAQFLLNKKLGKYYESVEQGVSILVNKVDLTKLKIELYYAMKNNISNKFCINNEMM
jgi:hypothetical protein